LPDDFVIKGMPFMAPQDFYAACNVIMLTCVWRRRYPDLCHGIKTPQKEPKAPSN
tara:strand:+ start:221 stop:385 length:165 start_codon:yes stop_codon:yes gene_type:complete